MPSPIAHMAAGYAIYRIFRSEPLQRRGLGVDGSTETLIAVIGLSLLPDLDAIPGFLTGDLSRFHNNLTHSLVTGFVAALAIGGAVWLKNRSGFVRWFSVALLSYQLHIVMDFFTHGRGIMLFWPFTDERYKPALTFFYGLRHSEGWLTIHHVWTLLSELTFAGALFLILYLYSRMKRNSKRSDVHIT
jgi:membrane-bound metal-dependent hydrolase YbcI (DUF457 family)